MLFACCTPYLFLPGRTLHLGDTVEMDESDGEELAAAGKPLIPATHVNFELDGSPESAHKLNEVYAQYRSLLVQLQ